MEKFFTLLALCAARNSLVTGEFPSQRPVTRSFDVFFDLCPNKWLSKQSWGWWFETPSCSLWHHCNEKTKNFSGVRMEYSRRNMPIRLLLMPWFLVSPGHQQSCYWQCRMNVVLSSMRKDFTYLGKDLRGLAYSLFECPWGLLLHVM